MAGSFNARGELEVSDGLLILAAGKKRSGKSVLALVLFDSFPDDRVVIDVNGDDGPRQDVIELRGSVHELPRRWPEEQREHPGQRMTLRYVPDVGSATFLEDVDAVVGLALAHGRERHHDGGRGCALLIHEIGRVAPANRTRPHMLRALSQNRHYRTTVIMCGRVRLAGAPCSSTRSAGSPPPTARGRTCSAPCRRTGTTARRSSCAGRGPSRSIRCACSNAI